MNAMTTKCSGLNHKEFILALDEAAPMRDVDWLLAVIEQSVVDGTVYSPGELVEFGPMLLRVVDENNYFSFSEPDFKEIPIVWVRGVTKSLRLLREQKDFGESFRRVHDLYFCTPRQSCVVGVDVDSDVNLFVLERTELDGSDSGWFIGRSDTVLDYSDPNSLRRSSIYEVLLTCPRIARFLAMPNSTRIEQFSKHILVSINGEVLEPLEGSFASRASS